MSYFFKRDLTTNNAPADNQIEVGELVINAKTGIMYSKRTDGKIIRFLSIPIDDTSPGNDLLRFVPVIKFSDVTGFCCNGDTLTITIDNLLVDNNYTFVITDTVAGSTAYFSTLSGSLTPTNSSRRYVSVNLAISSVQNNSLIKFSVLKNGVVLSENIQPICCTNCT
jgi:hypothetical protein